MNKDDKLSLILGFLKTVYINFKCLNFSDAIKLPIFLSHRVSLRSLRGTIAIESPIKTGMIRIGFGNVGIFDKRRSRTLFKNNGKITFKGTANIGHGSKFDIGGELFIGNNFSITAESSIICSKKIVIDDDCLMSWENLIMDTDFHKIKDQDGNVINEKREISIGKKVWIGCRCTILKGTQIGDGVVVAANSCLHGIVKGENQIVGGRPTKVLKENISWE